MKAASLKFDTHELMYIKHVPKTTMCFCGCAYTYLQFQFLWQIKEM